MNKMQLIRGKFYQDGKEVPPEFGNWEQINLIEAQKRRTIDFKSEGLIVKPILSLDGSITLISFLCQCGGSCLFESKRIDNLTLKSDLLGLKTECLSCKTKYKTDVYCGQIVVKFA